MWRKNKYGRGISFFADFTFFTFMVSHGIYKWITRQRENRRKTSPRLANCWMSLMETKHELAGSERTLQAGQRQESSSQSHTGSTTDRQKKEKVKEKRINNSNILLSHPPSTRQVHTHQGKEMEEPCEGVWDRFFDTWTAQVVWNWHSDGTDSCQNAFQSNGNFSNRIRNGRILHSGEAGGSFAGAGGRVWVAGEGLVSWRQQLTHWAPLVLHTEDGLDCRHQGALAKVSGSLLTILTVLFPLSGCSDVMALSKLSKLDEQQKRRHGEPDFVSNFCNTQWLGAANKGGKKNLLKLRWMYFQVVRTSNPHKPIQYQLKSACIRK